MGLILLVMLLYSLFLMVLLLACIKHKAYDQVIILSASVGWVISGQYINHRFSYYIQLFTAVLMLNSILIKGLSLATPAKTRYGSAKYFLSLSLIVAITSIANSTGYTGILRFFLLAVFVSFLSCVDKSQLQSAIGKVIVLQTIACLSIFSSRQPRMQIAYDFQAGTETYPNLVGHPNYLAYVAAINCVLFLFIFVNKRYLRTVGYFLNLSAILYSQCRSAALAAALGTVIFLLQRKDRDPTSKEQNRSFGNLFFVTLLPLVLIFLGGSMVQRFLQIADSGGLTGNNSLGWRVLQWKTVISQVHNFFWIGAGWQNSRHLLLSGLQAHDSFLQVFMELGIFGLIVYCLIILKIFNDFVRSRVGLTLIPVFLISSIVDAGILYPAIAFYVLLASSILDRSNWRANLENI